MTQNIRSALKALDEAWSDLHKAQKALLAVSPGTASFRTREAKYAKCEARLDDVRRNFGWVGEVLKTPIRERASDL